MVEAFHMCSIDLVKEGSGSGRSPFSVSREFTSTSPMLVIQIDRLPFSNKICHLDRGWNSFLYYYEDTFMYLNYQLDGSDKKEGLAW